ncbi:MAG: hypothetical protein DRQ44_06825 [Gammaproteobacteria bacterium]|nr:MAG: hypothetical protein DRQ44_06825 [Gammaproteobacteria bacterium]
MIKTPLIFDRVKSYYKNNRWQGRIILTLLIFALILGIVRLLLPQTIIYSTTSWLKSQGIDSSIEEININIINGTVSLVNAKGSKNGEPLFNIGLVDIYWRWAPLSEKTIVVTKIALDKFSVNIEQYNDEIIIAGVRLPLNTAGEIEVAPADIDKSDEQTTPWAASLGQVIFTRLNICYLQHAASLEQANKNSLFVDYCVDLEKMSWAGTISYATNKDLLKTDDLPISSTGNFTLKGLNVTDNKLNKKLLVSKSNTLSNVVISGLNNLHIDKLEMNDLSLLHREDKKHKDSIRFTQLAIDDIKLSNMNALAINNISISKPGVYLVKHNQTDWEYQQWIPQSSATGKVNEEDDPGKQTPSASSFKLTLNNISINDSDLCYLDSSSSLYYCLTFAELDWKGLVKFDTKPSKTDDLNLLVKGDLKLLRQNIHNLTIDRDLLDFESLTLSKLEISSIDNISLDNFNIEKFAALQRSKNKNDNTASFEELTINDIKYTHNKIDINTIKLTGLANTVSKNKSGDWEFDKWRLDNSSESKTGNKKATSKTIKTDTEKTTKEKETFIVSLNKLNITSDKKILFIDNSTETVMKVGLKKLAFDISNIHTDKPNSNSPFKLSAKTTRHATINIAGTAKPFAEKVSFDANGKIKGFDLRAASPAAKKAIGHIIKSGQLDADLKLLAVDGILDSKLGLSLYQFNIKATSKEDAEKLDAEFGMPLNQTLVLLRDKDDSIHLDIPVTGDVNNPDFNPMQAIIKATSKAATVTLITFFTPYGLIYAGGNIAFNLATALNFDPINFTPGSPEIPADGKEQLNGLSELLTEKPHVHLTLCGVTNQHDVFALYPELKQKKNSKNKDGETSSTEITLTKKQSLQLKQLAKERQVNSKNYLVNKSGIEHNRLILCAPEHKTDDDAIAGVEINI